MGIQRHFLEIFTALTSEVQVNGFLTSFFGLPSAVWTQWYFKLTYDTTNASTFENCSSQHSYIINIYARIEHLYQLLATNNWICTDAQNCEAFCIHTIIGYWILVG